MVVSRHALDEGANVGIDAWSSRPPPRASAPASPQAFATPPGNRGRLDQHQRVSPPRPHPLQADPEQTVGGAEASIRTSEDAQLVAEGENLEEDV